MGPQAGRGARPGAAEQASQLGGDAAAEGSVDPGVGTAVEAGQQHEQHEGGPCVVQGSGLGMRVPREGRDPRATQRLAAHISLCPLGSPRLGRGGAEVCVQPSLSGPHSSSHGHTPSRGASGSHAAHSCTRKKGAQHSTYTITITSVILTVLAMAADTRAPSLGLPVRRPPRRPPALSAGPGTRLA